jgi:hypothetical protein
MKTFQNLTATLILLTLAATASAQVVIVNAQNGVSALTKEQVEQLFMGKTSVFPGGGSAALLDNVALRDAFYQAVAGKSGDQVKTYWAKMEFTGKGKPPSESASGKAVAEQVAKNPAAVGYVDKGDVGPGVKAVLTLN